MYCKVLVNKKIISEKCKICKTFFSKLRGLMFRGLKDNESLLFEFKKARKRSIHMFFVFYTIKVIWISQDMEVVDIKTAKPFIPYLSSKKPAKYLLEIKNSKNIKINNKISLK